MLYCSHFENLLDLISDPIFDHSIIKSQAGKKQDEKETWKGNAAPVFCDRHGPCGAGVYGTDGGKGK